MYIAEELEFHILQDNTFLPHNEINIEEAERKGEKEKKKAKVQSAALTIPVKLGKRKVFKTSKEAN